MKSISTLLCILFFAGCNKEEMAKDAVVNAMTTGFWKVTSFQNGSTNVTTDFSTYKFRFKENLTVDAINNSTVEKTGNWAADPGAKTITSTFTDANVTISLLNGTWQITNNDWTFVEANQMVNGELRKLRLDKL